VRKIDGRAESSRLSVHVVPDSLTIVDFKLLRSEDMIRRTTRKLARLSVMASMIAFAAYGHAGTAAVTPALAACSKALIATLAKSDELPNYTVKAPSSFNSDLVDPNSFTVIARSAKTRELLAKASCKATPEGEVITFRAIPVKS
jgi:hypothetical protein